MSKNKDFIQKNDKPDDIVYMSRIEHQKLHSDKMIGNVELDVGLGLGGIVAVILSWMTWHSVGWAILHFWFGWFYVIYWLLFIWDGVM